MKRLYFLLLFLCALAGPQSQAQTLRVKLANGNNGKDVGNTGINLWVGDQRKDAVPLSIDSRGIGELHLSGREADKGIEAGSIPSTFLFAQQIRLQVGFVLCQSTRPKYSWLQITPYSTDEWTRAGIVTANTCGRAKAKPEPGLLTIFVRPLTFWEKLSE